MIYNIFSTNMGGITLRFMSLKDHVYEYISKRIQDGSIKPNDKLNEQEICDELNISRTPVREALIQLAADGLLDNEPRRGFRVKSLTEEKANNLYMIIGNLDALAATLALDNLTKEDINLMRKLKTDMDDAIANQMLDEYYKLQIDFHNIYIDKCGNDELIQLLNQLKMRFIRQGYDSNEKLAEIFSETNKQHGVIVDLMEKRDVEKLEHYLKTVHWNVMYSNLDVI